MESQISQQISDNSAVLSPVISVAFPIAIPGLFDYYVPRELRGKIKPGTPVLVEVRSRQVWGVAVQLKSASEFPELKKVLEARSEQWADENQSLIKLYEWIASYYQCELGRVFRPLIRKGLISATSKTIQVYSVVPRETDLLKSAYREIVEKLSLYNEFTAGQVKTEHLIKDSQIAYLFKNGYLQRRKKTVLREADELGIPVDQQDIRLTEEQAGAVEFISRNFTTAPRPFLLHGITGSGKTHIYIELAFLALGQGKGVIILVPEISLTPQTIQRFRSALGDVIAVIHSHMSDGERRDSLQELVTGNKRVIIGVRSAVLAPVENVGLIIVDEEHDASYKQSDLEPRYNARDVAVMRGYFQGALVVLGSATPSLESYFNALTGKYHLVKLSRRFGAATLPGVEIVDMGEEHRQNNWTPFSRLLLSRIQACLDNKRQIILLLNRRGFSTFLICKQCGHTYKCPNCSVNLRYHRFDNLLKCHLCGQEQVAPDSCPGCKGEQFKYKGTGIQKIEEILQEKFPEGRVLRMDQDTTRRKGAHISILKKYTEGEADILLGTQMVSKGLNFPGVALVGVIQADTGLHFPDFRASERTFELLTQVAGRAGRADNCGEVVIQTYFPEEVAVRASQNHDYETFYKTEIECRKELGYPPFGKLARIIAEGADELGVRARIEEVGSELRKKCLGNITILGPSPAVLQRVANQFRFSLLLKTQSPKRLNSVLCDVRKLCKTFPKAVKITIDVDPVNML